MVTVGNHCGTVWSGLAHGRVVRPACGDCGADIHAERPGHGGLMSVTYDRRHLCGTFRSGLDDEREIEIELW